MIRSVYDAASSMMAEMARELSISTDLSNVSTPGYKSTDDAISDFKDLLLSRIDGQSAAPIGSLSTAVKLAESAINLGQGALVETGNPFDLAIAGDAFFAVQTPSGTQYTRDGTFHLDADRRLITSDGMPVLGEHGAITVPQGDPVVEPDGTIRVAGNLVDRLQLTSFGAQPDLARAGQNRFTANTPGTPSSTSGVSQGFIEQSNVDVNRAMVKMLAAQRSYSLASRMLQLTDSSLELAVNDVGRVS